MQQVIGDLHEDLRWPSLRPERNECRVLMPEQVAELEEFKQSEGLVEIENLRNMNKQLWEKNKRQEEQREMVGVAALEREELLAAAAQHEVALAQKYVEVEEERRKLTELTEVHTSVAKHKNRIERELEAVKLTTRTQATQNTKTASTELVPVSGFFSRDGCP